MPPANPNAWTRTQELTRAMLGDDGFGVAREAGRAKPPEQAIAEASAFARDDSLP